MTSFFRLKKQQVEKSTCRQRRKVLSEILDTLELRQLLATVNYISGQLLIETDADNEALSILANTTAGEYTLTSTQNFNILTPDAGLANFTPNTLSIYSNLTNGLSLIQITNNASNSGSSLDFGNSTGNFSANLTVYFNNSSSGVVTIANAANFINATNLNIYNQGNAIQQSAPILTDTTGYVNFTARNIDLQFGSNITTDSGSITLMGDLGSQQPSDFRGVSIDSAVLNSNSGSFLIQGRAGNGTSLPEGVYVSNSTITTAGSGRLTINGISGTGLDDQYGVWVLTSAIQTENGTIVFNGNSLGTNDRAYGLYIGDPGASPSATITITGSANIEISGMGGASSGIKSRGVSLINPAFSIAGSGNVNITGNTQASGAQSFGAFILASIQVNNGNITVNGMSGTGDSALGVGIGIGPLNVQN